MQMALGAENKALASAAMVMAGAPAMMPATGRAQKAPLGPTAHASSAASPARFLSRRSSAAANSTQPTPEMMKGPASSRGAVRPQAANRPTVAAVIRSWPRRYSGQSRWTVGPARVTPTPSTAPRA